MSNAGPTPEADELRHQLAAVLSKHSIIVGIGNRQKGDDGFGPSVVDALEGKVSIPLIDAGVAPENYLQHIAGYNPDTVLFIDVAELDRAPGEIGLYSADDLAGGGISCHVGNISLIAKYIASATGAKCVFLLVQPSDVKYLSKCSPGSSDEYQVSELSPLLAKAVEKVCKVIVSSIDNV
ncbi:MAG: hydrogenase maturation protease [Planctomycetota bacterium]|nr:MAG: hydrogenase maturation protease [Planctomycetota bacterium]